jgi:hypothetical protein
MPTTVITTQVRQDQNVPFYLDVNPQIADAIQGVITASTNITSSRFTLSEDNLIHTAVALFEDVAKMNAFRAELNAVLPTFFNDRQAYSQALNISIARTVL